MRGFGLLACGQLDRYVVRLFAGAFLGTMLAMMALMIVISLAVDFDEHWGEEATLLLLGHFYLLDVPFQFLRMAPLITTLAALLTLARLMRRNEWVAAVAAGIRPLRLLLPFFACGLGVIGLALALDQVFLESIARHRAAVEERLSGKKLEEMSDLLVRDRSGRAIQVKKTWIPGTDGAGARLEDLESTFLDDVTWRYVRADRATWGEDGWTFEGARLRDLRENTLEWIPVELGSYLDFTPTDLALAWKAREHPLELTSREVSELIRRDPDNPKLRTLELCGLAYQIANVVLLLSGLPLLLQFGARGAWRGVLVGLLQGLLYFVLESIFRSFGMEGQIGPFFAAWTPTVLFASAGIVLSATA